MLHKWRCAQQPMTHRTKHSISQFAKMQKSGELKGKFKTPEELTIITCHNYPDEPLFIQNMKFLGITDYIVLGTDRTDWDFAYKLEDILSYLKTVTKRTPYVLICDARDVIFRDDPQKVVNIYENKECELLFNSTMDKGGFLCMPEKYKWYCKTVCKGRYLNAGVFIGHWDFVIEVLEEAMKYAVPGLLSHQEFCDLGRGIRTKKLCEALPEFPFPTGMPDQIIFRYILNKFYPRMTVDYSNEICYRN